MRNQGISVLLSKSIKYELEDLLSGHADNVNSDIGSRLRENVDRISAFRDLHEYLDANTLGESEQVWEKLTSDISEEGDEVKIQSACDVLNEAQSIVDEWIRNGGLKDAYQRVLNREVTPAKEI